jgi:hypothetical protein
LSPQGWTQLDAEGAQGRIDAPQVVDVAGDDDLIRFSRADNDASYT